VGGTTTVAGGKTNGGRCWPIAQDPFRKRPVKVEKAGGGGKKGNHVLTDCRVRKEKKKRGGKKNTSMKTKTTEKGELTWGDIGT